MRAAALLSGHGARFRGRKLAPHVTPSNIFSMIRFTLWKARPGNLLRASNRGVDAATSPVVRNNLGEGKMSELLRRFLNDDSGATAIEYGLIAAGISVAVLAVVNTLEQPEHYIQQHFQSAEVARPLSAVL